jgi:hypothetical protein
MDLGDYDGPMLYMSCRSCPRRGQCVLTKLIEIRGAAAMLPDSLALISADCPQRQSGRPYHEVCGVTLEK